MSDVEQGAQHQAVETPPEGSETTQVEDEQEERGTTGLQPRFSKPYGFWLVRWSVSAIVIIFVVTVGLGVWLDKFTTAAQLLAAMAAAFTAIGSLAGAYFGVKSGLDAQDKLNEARNSERVQQRELARVRSKGVLRSKSASRRCEKRGIVPC